MYSILEKSLDKSRALLFGLLTNCLFPESKKDCPLWELRNNLSTEKKYVYAIGLSTDGVKNIL